MAQDHFIEKHKTAWQRLEDLLKLLDGSSLRRLHREEVRELGKYIAAPPPISPWLAPSRAIRV